MNEFWNDKYSAKDTPWDIGYAAPAIVAFFANTSISRKSKILIPGCGYAHEADALLDLGYTNISLLENAEKPLEYLAEKYRTHPAIQLLNQDFFEHRSGYNFIVEQTFFCALLPKRRKDYAQQIQHLLKPEGKLVGLLFDRNFEGGPPFGGSQAEYRQLFEENLIIDVMKPCQDSIAPRQGSELWIEMRRI